MLLCVSLAISVQPIAVQSALADTSNSETVDSELKDEFTKQANEYETLFAKGDASALSQLWTEDGSLKTADGRLCKGREALKQYFQKDFARFGKQKLSVKITALQKTAPGVVVEEGLTSVGTGDLPTGSYTAIHVKVDNAWKMAWVKETSANNRSIDSVKDLGWLAGKWKAKSPDGKELVMQAKWIEDGNFLECVTLGQDGQSEARQIIGYNPVINTLVSWHFTPTGAYGRGQWSKVAANGWQQSSTGIALDGTSSSATYTLKLRSKDSFTWQSTERFIGGVSIPDSAVLVLNRVGE
jgi:uncharacterized protein (TIGR02246 family)